jgi:hypothetical protein
VKRARDRWITAGLAVVGLAVCGTGLIGFIWAIFENNLPWHPEQSARDYYQDVGQFYSLGFATGFFICFFLILLAAAVRWWAHSRRPSRGTAVPSPARRGAS